MRSAIGFFVGFVLAVVAVTAIPAWGVPKGHQAQSLCECGCAVQGGVYSVNVVAPNNDPNQCRSLNTVDCTMGASAGSNNKGKLQDCKGSVVVVDLSKRPVKKATAATGSTK